MKKSRKIGQKIKEARIRKGLKQSEVAKILGITQGALSHYEKGSCKPSLDKVYKLKDLLEFNL